MAKIVGYKLIKVYTGYPTKVEDQELKFQTEPGVWRSKPKGKGGFRVKDPQNNPCWQPLFDIDETFGKMTLHGHRIEKTSTTIGFGCQKFSKVELLGIRRLIVGDARANISVNGQRISPELVDYLISKL